MSKLKLNLDEIKVESFKTNDSIAEKGTILAQESWVGTCHLSRVIECGHIPICWGPEPTNLEGSNCHTCMVFDNCDYENSLDATCINPGANTCLAPGQCT